MKLEQLRILLEEKTQEYNNPDFIPFDPVCIPHSFSLKQDIEISGFFSAILAWGQRVTIINKCRELLQLMDNAPYEFILHHREQDLKAFLNFRHRTFNATDLLYFIAFFKNYYQRHDSLENAFFQGMNSKSQNVESGIIHFRNTFFSLDNYPARTTKHVSTPANNSACKRINMFLRWMVRTDSAGVDFGIWKKIKPSQLLCPCDVHVDRVARRLGLIKRKQTDWKTVLELTQNLRKLDAADPAKYDFALFGLGIMEKQKIYCGTQ
jgi:uncharacterized protein (TIGR02757 family)